MRPAVFRVASPLDPVELAPGALDGTIGGLAKAAMAAGFEVRAFTGFGVRVPKLDSQQFRWQAWECLYGRHDDGRAFQARNDDEGWHVDLIRPGWPRMLGSTVSLRALLKAGA